MTEVTVIILTRDEELHIARAIASVKGFAARVLVVDSGSTDSTVALARAAGAEVISNAWTTHAAQFNWALDQIAGQGGWVLRLDADEVVTPELASEIARGLPDVAGLYLRRNIRFQGAMVRYGGVYRLPNLRLFREGRGRAEARWMDEHIVVDGPTAHLSGAIVDDNLGPLDGWIAKHNGYASREVADLLLRPNDGGQHHGAKRWVKRHLYGHLPGGARAVAYFLYRYLLRGGFRDRAAARRFHVLQGFWYRYLVDAKLAEVRRHMQATGATPARALEEVLGLRVPADLRRAA
jgi:glycosyltransferase involved in cell wall biosynthesis